MPEADEDQQTRPRKPNWVEIGTLAVLSITLIGVWVYACEAHRANKLTAEAIEINSRPLVVVAGYSENGGENSVACAYARNVGKSPAITMIPKYAGFSTIRLPSGPDLPENTDQMIVLPTQDERIDFNDSVSRTTKGFFYVKGLITYGRDYKTWFCREFEIASPSVHERDCTDRNSNGMK